MTLDHRDTALMRAIIRMEEEGLTSQVAEYKTQLGYQLLGLDGDAAKGNTTTLAYQLLGMVLKQVPTATPKQFVKTRPIRGGKRAPYVEVGYVKQVLNTVFGPFWSFTRVGNPQYLMDPLHVTDGRLGIIVVRCRLTVSIPTPLGWQDISKEAVGEAEIQRFGEGTGKNPNPNAGKAVNLGDDEKAAESDALKRCASYLGIAADVYWGKDEVKTFEEEF